MKTKFMLTICLFILLNSGCKKDGGGIASLFIPNFSNLWTSSRGTLFSFVPNATNVSKGTFSGTEDDAKVFHGSFDSYYIEFTFDEVPNVKYSGQFVKDSNPLTMVVKGTNNVELTIVKN